MPSSPADQRHYEPTLEDLMREFPQWHCWRGVNHLVYARMLKSSPPIVVRREDTISLRDEIIRIIWRIDHLGVSRRCDPVSAVCTHNSKEATPDA
jgi:hypothetical protein